jgi:outer membrane protein TolC
MKPFFLLIFLAIFSIADAQNIMTVDDALKIALKNNYGILIASNDAAISKTNNTIENAGMTPNVSLTGSGSYNPKNTTSYRSINSGVELSWTLFDGGKMFVTKNKLNEIQTLGEIQFKDKVLQTQYSVVSAYYDVVRQKQQLNSINEIINYNKELVRILQTSFDGGSVRKSNLLQAKIDLNVYTENFINQEFTIDAAKKYLNELLGVSSDSTFEVSESIPTNFSFNKSELLQKLSITNTSILSFQKQMDVAKLGLKEYNKARFPQISFKAGYYISQIDNASSKFGPQFGGSILIPIYQSGKIRRQISTAKLDVLSAEYDLENIKLQVKNDLLNAITQFENQQRLQVIEKENNALTKENLEISLQRMKLGQTTSLEVHLAQENYVQSCTRLINFEYNLKVAETKLRQLLDLM